MQVKTTEMIKNKLVQLDSQLAVVIDAYDDIEITLAENILKSWLAVLLVSSCQIK